MSVESLLDLLGHVSRDRFNFPLLEDFSHPSILSINSRTYIRPSRQIMASRRTATISNSRRTHDLIDLIMITGLLEISPCRGNVDSARQGLSVPKAVPATPIIVVH
jgi:hypothetical protein